MDRRGGCCIARYAYDISKLNKIMQRFRPIAPKPVSASPETYSGIPRKTGRGRRKTTNTPTPKRRKCWPENIKTLPLLPEERLSFGRRAAATTSWVKVECVTDTWQLDSYPYRGIGGRTDEERVRSLEGDTCPGFVSDGLERVRWTNAAYRRMVAAEACLVVEDGVALPPPVGCSAFTCRVRVVTCGNEKASKTVPCDVWRMDCGGFAWRLDTAAALSLWIGD